MSRLIAAVAAAAGAALAAVHVAADGAWRGRVVLITGGGRGLGLALAEALVARGAAVALVARDGGELRAAAARFPAQAVTTIVADVRSAADAERAVAACVARFGRLDALINNAGIITVGPFVAHDVAQLDDSLAVHVRGPWLMTSAALPHLVRARGRVIDIASIGGVVGLPHLAAYCAGKHGLVGLSSALRAELAPRGVRVTTVCPWLMRTGSVRQAVFVGDHAAEHAWFALGGTLPVVTLGARRAAAAILRASARGAARVLLGVPAKALYAASAAAPRVASAALARVARALPRERGERGVAYKGYESASRHVPADGTRAGARAAARWNEGVLGGERVAR